ncbi:Ubiquitin-associated protein like [Actinidia chinensis var. chinensis]|uniref:Ubiquitin-associated protein like n=1 Tax=Actinidia chinensis var. chinensis TaxID=1590841 RepID=A0A2R6PVQ1_ACTCC|nr:Ubiquitin-associated protein like [Actinidia chinensis var. chinensis]
MEVSSIVSRPIPSIRGSAGIDVQSRSPSSSKPSLLGMSVNDRGRSRSSSTSRGGGRGITKFSSGLGLGFSDKAHLQYYSTTTTQIQIRCSAKLKEKDTPKANKKKIKKRLKLLKGLSKDLSTFSHLGFGLDPHDHGLLDQVKGQKISEATELLLGQLEQLSTEEKEMKRKRKDEKAKLKAAANMQKRLDCDSSSSGSSSESSDSECGEVVDINSLKTEAIARTAVDESQQATLTLPSTLTKESNTTIGLQSSVIPPSTMNQEGRMTEEGGVGCSTLNLLEQQCCTSGTSSISCNSLMVGAYHGDGGRSAAAEKKIGVCMGGKCKKSGAAALLEEFQRVLGVEGAVQCKCMGKCRNAPNVRILNGVQADDSVRAPTNPLFIGVGFEDVNLIVANYFGETNKELGLAAAS